jgi:hypothetical protein
VTKSELSHENLPSTSWQYTFVKLSLATTFYCSNDLKRIEIILLKFIKFYSNIQEISYYVLWTTLKYVSFNQRLIESYPLC